MTPLEDARRLADRWHALRSVYQRHYYYLAKNSDHARMQQEPLLLRLLQYYVITWRPTHDAPKLQQRCMNCGHGDCEDRHVGAAQKCVYGAGNFAWITECPPQ